MMPSRRMPWIAPRSWSLAQVISARHGWLEQRWPMMAFLFEQLSRAHVSISNTYHATHPSIFMSPRVLLSMLVPHRAEKQGVVVDRTHALPFSREAATMTLAASQRSKQKLQEQDDVIARMVRRAMRDENPSRANRKPPDRTSARPAQAAERENAVAVHDLPASRVFRRAAKGNDEVSSAAGTDGREQAKQITAPGRAIAAAATVQPPIDITRITDQVLQTLDRRIVAHRERMGRM